MEDVLFEYYDEGVGEALVMLPPVCGSALVYYQQVMSLSVKGYRVISLTAPAIADVSILAKVLDVSPNQ
jgi:hypothetical protein